MPVTTCSQACAAAANIPVPAPLPDPESDPDELPELTQSFHEMSLNNDNASQCSASHPPAHPDDNDNEDQHMDTPGPGSGRAVTAGSVPGQLNTGRAQPCPRYAGKPGKSRDGVGV